MVNLTAFLQALGWAIVNSLWQYAALWFMYLFISNAVLQKKAATKHNLAVVLQLTGFVLFIYSLLINLIWPTTSNLALHINIGNSFLLNVKNKVLINAGQFLPYLSVLYLLITSLLFVQFTQYYLHSKQLISKGLSKIDLQYRLFVQHTKLQLNITKKIAVYVSSQIDTPLVVGFIKPFILIPAACINQLSTQQLEAILLHELFHIKRNDYLVNIFVALSEVFLFFNPFAVLLVKEIRSERENNCDDIVLQLNYPAQTYASALLAIETNRRGLLNAGIAATGNGEKLLLKRVQRIVNAPVKNELPYKYLALLLLVVLFFVSAFMEPVIIKKAAMVQNNVTPKSQVTFANFANNIFNGTHIKKQNKYRTLKHGAEENNNEETVIKPVAFYNLITAAADENELVTETNLLRQTARTETNAFSFEEAALPISGDESLGEHPYIPATSYEFYAQQDTSIPKIKKPTYNEYKVQQEQKKAKLALEKMNWDKIEKELKYSKKDIARLKAELNKALADIDFSAVQREAIAKEVQEIQQQKYQMELENYRQHIYMQQQKLMQDYQQQMEIRKQQNLEEQKHLKELQQKNIELIKKQKQVYI